MSFRETAKLNETFEIMTHPDRRYVLYHLSERAGVVDFDTLVSGVVEWEADRTNPSRERGRDSVAVALRHVHLPKLDAAGMVTFDADAGTVELGQAERIPGILGDAASVEGYVQPAAND